MTGFNGLITIGVFLTIHSTNVLDADNSIKSIKTILLDNNSSYSPSDNVLISWTELLLNSSILILDDWFVNLFVNLFVDWLLSSSTYLFIKYTYLLVELSEDIPLVSSDDIPLVSSDDIPLVLFIPFVCCFEFKIRLPIKSTKGFPGLI